MVIPMQTMNEKRADNNRGIQTNTQSKKIDHLGAKTRDKWMILVTGQFDGGIANCLCLGAQYCVSEQGKSAWCRKREVSRIGDGWAKQFERFFLFKVTK